MKQPWLWVALILLATLGSKQCTPSAPVTLIEKQTSDTVTLTRIDTVVVERPVPVRVVETRTDTLLLYRPQDTIRVPVPISCSTARRTPSVSPSPSVSTVSETASTPLT